MIIGMGLGMVDRDIEVGKEYKVGTFTLNGVTYNRYVKVIDFGALPNNDGKSISHGISNLTHVLDVRGITYESSNNIFYPIPWVSPSGTTFESIYADPGVVRITNNFNDSGKKALVILEYYK